jgi:hypothetical protein
MGCEKLDPYLFTCADNPGVRCVDVPLSKCVPKLSVEKKSKVVEASF